MADDAQSDLTNLTVDLLCAYVTNNNVQHGDLPDLIKTTHAALKTIDSPEPAAPAEPEHTPAVGLRKSLASRTHIISMIDGKAYQTLKRHLKKHDLTPQQYRERYSLPGDYPMVAPAYSESRRAIAERLGLGRKVTDAQASSAAPAPEPAKADAAKAAPKTAAKAARLSPSKSPAKPKPADTPKPTAQAKDTTEPKVTVATAAQAPKKAAVAKAGETAKKPSKPRTAAKPAAAAPSAAVPAAAAEAPKPAPKKRAAKSPAAEPAN